MLRFLIQRWKQGYKTFPFPAKAPVLPERFRGLPEIDQTKFSDGGNGSIQACPTAAIFRDGEKLSLDLGRCLFCAQCQTASPEGAIKFTREYRMAARQKDDLVLRENTVKLAAALEEKTRKLFGRSLQLRQVSAGGCNGCESDVNVLNTLVYDLGRHGIQFVASPRHADGLLVTGAVTENMRLALEKTYEAVPSPKIVIAVGACAISGGPYIDHAEVLNGVANVIPVDLYIPGCPPHPYTILDGLLRLLGKIS